MNNMKTMATRRRCLSRWALSAWLTVPGLASGVVHGEPSPQPSRLQVAFDPTGLIGTFKQDGPVDHSNPFFQSLGSNGRSCSTCHDAAQALSITPLAARRRYAETRGADPLFASIDGANCPNVSRRDRAGHSLLLQNGLIRVGLAVPANAEFSISAVHDPYGCALQVDAKTGLLTASVYRRPLPTANLRFLSVVMFDGRETISPLTSDATFGPNLRADLKHQAIDATLGHAEAVVSPTDAQVDGIVDFELALFTGQLRDLRAGALQSGGALGGPLNLAAQTYYPGINDTLGQDPSGAPFDPVAMTLYGAWLNLPARGSDDDRRIARADIAAGEALFNNAPITITNVRGLNDNAVLHNPTSFVGHCTSCHDAPNVGDHSLPLPLDIGTSHTAAPNLEPDAAIVAGVNQLSMPDLPVFLISGCPNPFNPGQAESFYTTDPGRALITGHCADFNRIKGPILRGLAARAPYFHNGAAATLLEAVNFYDQRFQMGLTGTQKKQLVAFLNSL
jgi:cytochrome c peroxidase